MILDLDFYSGYLVHFIAHVLEEEGAEESGLYNYYASRVPKQAGLPTHERAVARYIARTFDADKRWIIEIGMGIGTLTLYLGVLGYPTLGIEVEPKRLALARRLRDSALVVWPELASRYAIAEGFFPAVLRELRPLRKDTLLLFTNVNATWPPGTTEAMIAEFARAGDVILDLRLFGELRDLVSEREALAQAILLAGATGMVEIPAESGQYYRHFQFT